MSSNRDNVFYNTIIVEPGFKINIILVCYEVGSIKKSRFRSQNKVNAGAGALDQSRRHAIDSRPLCRYLALVFVSDPAPGRFRPRR